MTLSVERTPQAVGVPYAMTDPTRVPGERYLDRAFFELEKEKFWPYVWQMACRGEEIPKPGDFVEYEICGQSVLVVRQADGSVKAFENACRHRATQLGVGDGRFAGGQIVCPFHGWRWNLDGTSSYVFHADQAAPVCMDPEELRLRECAIGMWGGCVWINLDRHARPMHEALSPAAEILDGLGVGNMRVKYWKEVILNANWKIAQEAFLEGVHVMQTHPQLVVGADEHDEYPHPTVYTIYENGHSQFAGGTTQKAMSADDFMELMRGLWTGQDAMTLEREVRLIEGLRHKVPTEENFGRAAVRAYYAYCEGAGIPLPPMERSALWGGEVFVFPNFFILPQWANALSYRCRPYNNDPEWCRFEVWSLMTYPDGEEPEERPVRQQFAQDDTEHWGLIPLQDFSNIERQQRGLHTPNFDASRLYPEWEKSIANMHQELDRYLAR